MHFLVEVAHPSHELTMHERLEFLRLQHLKEGLSGFALQLLHKLGRGRARVQGHVVKPADEELPFREDVNQGLNAKSIVVYFLLRLEVVSADCEQHTSTFVCFVVFNVEVLVRVLENVVAVNSQRQVRRAVPFKRVLVDGSLD